VHDVHFPKLRIQD